MVLVLAISKKLSHNGTSINEMLEDLFCSLGGGDILGSQCDVAKEVKERLSKVSQPNISLSSPDNLILYARG